MGRWPVTTRARSSRHPWVFRYTRSNSTSSSAPAPWCRAMTCCGGLRGPEFDSLERAINVYVSRLRRKLGDDADTATRIKTMRDKGCPFARDECGNCPGRQVDVETRFEELPFRLGNVSMEGTL